jgi:hypothetical protein
LPTLIVPVHTHVPTPSALSYLTRIQYTSDISSKQKFVKVKKMTPGQNEKTTVALSCQLLACFANWQLRDKTGLMRFVN